MAASKPTTHKETTMTTNDDDTPEPEHGEEDTPTERAPNIGGGSITITGEQAQHATIDPEQWDRWNRPVGPPPSDPFADSPKKVYEAIMTLMDMVQSIAKGGLAPKEAGGYRYRSLEDVLAKIGPAARSVGLAVQSHITACDYHVQNTERHTWTWCRLRVLYRFTSLEDGSTFEFESAGEGRDNTDKATSKAMSMALKYGLSQAFLIDLGEPDPDGEKPMDTPEGDVHAARREQQRQTQAEASKAPQQRQWDAERQQHRPAPDRAGRARQALAAAQNVRTQQELTAIAHQAQQEGLMGEQIGGMLLADRLTAIKETLP